MQLTVRDVAELLNLSEKTIYRMIQKREVPAYRVHEQYRFNRSEVLEWATSKKIHVSAEMFSEANEPAIPFPSLVEAIEAGGIHYRIEGNDRQSVLRGVIDAMRLPDGVDRDFLYRVLLAREEMASTGIGDGIAIPHVRNPLVLQVPKPTITLCFLEKPVDFAALDAKPVNCLFMLISPSTRAHLYLISRLCFALRDPAVKEAVVKQESRERILGELRRMQSQFRAADSGEVAPA